MRVVVFALALMWAFAPALWACETALLLLIDTSSSIDEGEYRLQADGTADAVLDGDVADQMVRGQVAVAVMHWSGSGDTQMVVPWTQVRSGADLPRLAALIRAAPRSFTGGSTATGYALWAGARAFENAPSCERRVIDISTDGMRNTGTPESTGLREVHAKGIVVNGIAIESIGQPVTRYLMKRVVTPGGFVLTARRYDDYPRTIRDKILREISFAMM